MCPTCIHWAHWGYLSPVTTMCSACSQQVNDPLPPVLVPIHPCIGGPSLKDSQNRPKIPILSRLSHDPQAVLSAFRLLRALDPSAWISDRPTCQPPSLSAHRSPTVAPTLPSRSSRHSLRFSQPLYPLLAFVNTFLGLSCVSPSIDTPPTYFALLLPS